MRLGYCNSVIKSQTVVTKLEYFDSQTAFHITA